MNLRLTRIAAAVAAAAVCLPVAAKEFRSRRTCIRRTTRP